MRKMLIKEGMLQLGRKLKLGLFIIMAIITLPTAATINVVSTTSDYSTKSNLTETTGSYMTEATMLVYDEILRYQRNVQFTHGLDEAALAAFDFDAFAGNALWLMDELVGIESDWRKTASPGIKGNTAYGYAQFTEPTIKTATTRYRYHIEKFNSRSILGRRDWQPRGYKNSTGLLGGTKMKYPKWLTDLEDAIQGQLIGTGYISSYNHEEEMNKLTYDQMLALAFVHLHGENSKDYNFVQLAKGDITAAKDLYKRNHHTNPDADTLARIELFFQIH